MSYCSCSFCQPLPNSRSSFFVTISRPFSSFIKLQIARFILHHPISGISFLSHFVSLLISLLHIHCISNIVHVHRHHLYPPPPPPLPLTILFTLSSKPTYFTSLSHRSRLLVPYTPYLHLATSEM